MKRALGTTLVIVSAVSFGSLPILGQFAYRSGMDAPTMLFLRFFIAALLMLLWMGFRKISLPIGRNFLQLVGMGALGYVGQSLCYLSAIQYASTGLVALLLYLYPVIVSILSVLFLKARVTPRKLVALVLATLGATLTVDPHGGQIAGILLAVAAAIIYSFYIILGAGIMQKVTAVQSSAVIFSSAALVFGIISGLKGPHWPNNTIGYGVVLAIALFSTVLPVATFLTGLKIIGPTDASLLSTLEPVITVSLAVLFLGERIQPIFLLGGLLILVAVLLTVNQKSSFA
ncbi:MAG: DMT family transporter [Chloroflexi bacterium]|nr:DMT family transporter [Chloroflexota bacterium]